MSVAISITMKALIILAHGSRRQESNKEIITLAKEVKIIAGNEYKIIEPAYLEIVDPTLLQSIDQVVEAGISDITVLPYFLNSGNHVKRDIPAMIETATYKYPECRFKISAFIGKFEGMPDLILKQARLS